MLDGNDVLAGIEDTPRHRFAEPRQGVPISSSSAAPSVIGLIFRPARFPRREVACHDGVLNGLFSFDVGRSTHTDQSNPLLMPGRARRLERNTIAQADVQGHRSIRRAERLA